MSALSRPTRSRCRPAKALLNTREQLGLTQQQLADIVGAHRTAITAGRTAAASVRRARPASSRCC